jgi:hypothetical protein
MRKEGRSIILVKLPPEERTEKTTMPKAPAIPMKLDISILSYSSGYGWHNPPVIGFNPCQNIIHLIPDNKMLARKHNQGGVGIYLDGFNLMRIYIIFDAVQPGYFYHCLSNLHITIAMEFLPSKNSNRLKLVIP